MGVYGILRGSAVGAPILVDGGVDETKLADGGRGEYERIAVR
jgi:hypothetical protein